MRTQLLVFLGVGLAAAAVETQSSRATVQGVWRIEAFTHYTEPTNTQPQPSLYLFTAKHYAMLRVTSPTPRIALADPGVASAAELLATWGNNGFIANGGTYELSGGRLIIRPIVAKDPNVMTADFFIEYAATFEGDALVLAELRDNKRSGPYPTTYKLRRVE
jgi:hypothetical protein